MHDMTKIMPQMIMGRELLEAMAEYPEYEDSIRKKSSTERLLALSDIYDIYIPSRMSVEIYHKLYMGMMRSLQKKGTLQAVRQQYENRKSVMGKKYQGIIGGSDSFSVVAPSGTGKSSAVLRSLRLLMEKEVIELENPYCKIAPCIVVQCPFDSSVKGLMLEILRKVDEVFESKYYENAVRARVTTDMLIGSVSQVALNHIGLLVVDEIQHVVNSRNGKALVGMLTQLINNSGISICMVGTPECIPFFEQAFQLARRSLGLQYGLMEFGEEFCEICRALFQYQYTREGMVLTDGVLEWLFEHCGGNISVLVALFHDAQEMAVLDGTDRLDMAALESAYKKRLAMLHDYIEPVMKKKKQCSQRKKEEMQMPDIVPEAEKEEIKERKTMAEIVREAKDENKNIVEMLRKYFCVEEVAL